MDSSAKVWVRTSDKKTISLPMVEGTHSCLIETLSTAYNTGTSKKKPTNIWISKKDIRLFQAILHKPALYEELTREKYFNALRIAERLKAPFLYTTLLNAQLPPTICALITHKYICHRTIYEKMYDVFFVRTKYEPANLWVFTTKPTWCIEAETRLAYLIHRITLPQATILMNIHRPNYYNTCAILLPHMPGYDAITSWKKHDQDFLFNNLPVIVNVKKTKLGNQALCAFYFNT